MNTGLVSKWIVFILFLFILPFSISAGGRQETKGPNDTVIREAELSVPVSDVVLFSTGVGYFQREVWVEGSGSLDLYFNQADVNDLLKSMIQKTLYTRLFGKCMLFCTKLLATVVED